MKKSILLAVAVISIATVSCKKEHTCECTTVSTTVTTSGSISQTTTSTSSSKTTAEKQTKKYFRMDQGCYGTTSKNTNSGTGYTSETTNETACTLK